MSKKTLRDAPADAGGDDALEALSFEQAQAELERIVAQLEEGELSLEASLALHARGTRLAALCAKRLETAELRVKELTDQPE